MNRCATSSKSSRQRWIALAIASAAAVAALVPLSAEARRFPINALRGRIVFTSPPDIELNGDPARLSPGVRIHGFDNMMVVTGAVAGTGRKYVVDYTVESLGLVSEIWLLTADEADVSPWPRDKAEAGKWTFDYMAQTWTKP